MNKNRKKITMCSQLPPSISTLDAFIAVLSISGVYTDSLSVVVATDVVFHDPYIRMVFMVFGCVQHRGPSRPSHEFMLSSLLAFVLNTCPGSYI